MSPDSSTATPSQRLAAVQERIRLAAQDAGRPAEEIRLLAVSKTKPAADVQALMEAGQRDFGENYLQEAEDKIATLSGLEPRPSWHFIGPIQSNKTRAISRLFDWVQSVDRLKIARRLSEQRPPELPPLNVCIQVNISREAQKAGVLPESVAELADEMDALPGLRLRGLMAIPAAHEDPAQQRQSFAALRGCLESLQASGHSLDTLSMGMSGDLEAAIMEGATLLRIGTALFGPRD